MGGAAIKLLLLWLLYPTDKYCDGCLLTICLAVIVYQFLVCMFFIEGRAVNDVIIADVCLARSLLVMCVIDAFDILFFRVFHITFACIHDGFMVVNFFFCVVTTVFYRTVQN